MSKIYTLDTGRYIEIGNTLTLVRIHSMDGIKKLLISRNEINEIRKALMARVPGKICIHLTTGLNVTIFPNRMNIGLFKGGNGALLSASEFVDIYAFINPLFAKRKVNKSIVAGFFGALFVR